MMPTAHSAPFVLSNPELVETDDCQLLADFQSGAETAFTLLVRRHIDAVYSSALRQVQDSHTAADVTSAVFIVFARKARSLPGDTIIPAWLHRTTRYTALRAVRARTRRRYHEQEAARMQNTTDEADVKPVWNEIAPLLDDGLTQLPAKDHEAVVLRFFQGKSFPEIASLTGSTEEGSRKRLNRAVEKLRQFLSKRGVIVPAVALTASLAANSVQASPAALASSIIAAGTAAVLTPLAEMTLRAIWWRLSIRIACSVAMGIIGTAVIISTLRYFAPVSTSSPLQTFQLLSEAGMEGNGERWSSFVHVRTQEEKQVASLLASNIVLQSEFRRALIQRFGDTDYQASEFPRLLDDTPPGSFFGATENKLGDKAIVHLPRGSNLHFLRIKGVWKFDYFGTIQTPAVMMGTAAEKNLVTFKEITRQVKEGLFNNVADAQFDFKQKR